MVKITIIIPCYNASKYIEKCVEALENQSFRDFDVIMIDDGSSDNTVDLIVEISKRVEFKITLIKNEINLGPAASRNKAVSYTKSEYITFCDCDDWYDADFLELMYSNMVETSANLAFCGYKIVNEFGKTVSRPICTNKKRCNIKDALHLDADSLCMMMVKSSIMKSLTLPDIRNGEDMAVIPILMIKAQGCVIIPDCLYNYYRRSDSASQTPSLDVVSSLDISFRYIEQNFPKEFEKELEYIGIRNLLYAELITLFTFSYDKKRGKEIIDRFEKNYPGWINNLYIKEMPKYKKIFLLCANKRLYFVMKLLSFIRKVITRN